MGYLKQKLLKDDWNGYAPYVDEVEQVRPPLAYHQGCSPPAYGKRAS